MSPADHRFFLEDIDRREAGPTGPQRIDQSALRNDPGA